MCTHETPCPSAETPDRAAARILAAHPEQGWNLLCNDVILFDDGGLILPGGRTVPPPRIRVPGARRPAPVAA